MSNFKGLYEAYKKRNGKEPTSGKLYDWALANGKISKATTKKPRIRKTRLESKLAGVEKGYLARRKIIEKECEKNRKLAERIKKKAIKMVEAEFKLKKKRNVNKKKE